MKRAGFVVLSLLLFSLNASAQQDDFFDFINDELKSFDAFIDEANKDFVDFMRNPWVQLQAKQPIQKKEKPKPVAPVVFDAKTTPKPEKPVQLDIQSILDQSSKDGSPRPVVKVKDVDDLTIEKPKPVVKPQVKPAQKPIVKVEPKPIPAVKPVVKPEVKPAPKPEVKPVPKPEVKPAPKPEVKPVPKPEVKPIVKPAPIPEAPRSPLYAGGSGRTKVAYGGKTFYVDNSISGKCRLKNLKENAVADAYEAMYKTDYRALLKDCAQIKADLQLNDWGVFTFIRSVADAFCSSGNESVVMQQFLLNEMGYKAKMARKSTNDEMLLFVATDCKIYGHPYIEQGGLTYYNINGTDACAFYMCEKEAPAAKNRLQMYLHSAPQLGGEKQTSTHKAKGSTAQVSLGVSKSLMDFYGSFPQCDYGVYVKAPVDKEFESALLSSLRPLIAGKSEEQAANLLINFVQTAFEYATDQQQFAYEKPFFVEELFYYPYCDCEDRSILYSYLVRNLLGLDVVLLNYPNHIATAVRFNENIKGDYMMIGGKKYVICDPTYIGADVGMAMPNFRSVAAEVLRY